MNMKTFAHLPLLAFALATPACVVDDVDDSAFYFDWQIEDVGLPINDVLTCDEAGAETVVLEVQNVSNGSAKQTFSYPCRAGAGKSPVLATGQYAVTLRLLRGDNIEVSSISFPGPGQPAVFIDRRGVTDLGTTVFEVQSFSVQWLLTRTAAPTIPVSCASVGATNVQMTATTANLPPFTFNFACADPGGLTQAVPDGDYALQFRLLNAAGASLSELAVPFATPVDRQAVLPPVTFTVN